MKYNSLDVIKILEYVNNYIFLQNYIIWEKTIDILKKMILRENTCKQKKHKQVI